MKRLLGLLAALLLVLGLAACGGGDEEPDQTPQERLAEAKQTFDDAAGVRVDLSTDRDEFPSGTNGILQATGVGVKDPAGFTGDLTAITGGLSATVPTIATGGKVYVDFGGWNVIDPADFGAPDPATLFAADGGFSSLLVDVQGLEAGEDTRRGESVLSTLTGTLSGEQVQAIIPLAAAEDFEAEYLLTEDNRLDQVVLTGPFYPGEDDVTYTIAFSDYGATETITAPQG